MNNIIKEIADMKDAFFKANGKAPTTIYLTSEKENELLLLENFPIHKFPREVYATALFGLKPEWDSNCFKVG